ncbi:MAG: SEL1-like repeat protein [Bacteroidales bacterium]|nr:SEL1-like repeat protein [Bacteroidales bacterium]
MLYNELPGKYRQIRRFLLLPLAILSCLIADAQYGDDDNHGLYTEAFYYKQGINKPYHPARAFNMYMDLANEGYAEAMNALAIMYARGSGTDTNYVDAYTWFERAALAGYHKAYYNMGLLWKYGYGVVCDEKKALESYVTGADLGDPDCKYAAGYMSYKGIACPQDYEKALKMFFEAANQGHAAASYMTGICYRNGYGIQKDEEEAKRWLELSAGAGNFLALAELAAEKPENHFNTATSPPDTLYGVHIPENYIPVEHDIHDTDITGKYSGFLVTYDWSGQYVINLASLDLDLKRNGNTLTGLWEESDSLSAKLNATVTDTGLVFENVNYLRTDHYHRRPISFDFRSADIHLTKADSVIFLSGNIRFFSEVTMEAERPMYISLIRTDYYSGPDDPPQTEKPLEDLCVFPNPFSDRINISFKLNGESEVSATVFSTGGRKLYQADFGKLAAGVNIQQLQLNMPGGVYVVKLSNGNFALTTRIIRLHK